MGAALPPSRDPLPVQAPVTIFQHIKKYCNTLINVYKINIAAVYSSNGHVENTVFMDLEAYCIAGSVFQLHHHQLPNGDVTCHAIQERLVVAISTSARA